MCEYSEGVVHRPSLGVPLVCVKAGVCSCGLVRACSMAWGRRAGVLSQGPCAWLWRRRCLLVWR